MPFHHHSQDARKTPPPESGYSDIHTTRVSTPGPFHHYGQEARTILPTVRIVIKRSFLTWQCFNLYCHLTYIHQLGQHHKIRYISFGDTAVYFFAKLIHIYFEYFTENLQGSCECQIEKVPLLLPPLSYFVLC